MCVEWLSLLSSWDHVVRVEWLCLCCLHGIMWCVLSGSVSAVFMGSCGVCWVALSLLSSCLTLFEVGAAAAAAAAVTSAALVMY